MIFWKCRQKNLSRPKKAKNKSAVDKEVPWSWKIILIWKSETFILKNCLDRDEKVPSDRYHQKSAIWSSENEGHRSLKNDQSWSSKIKTKKKPQTPHSHHRPPLCSRSKDFALHSILKNPSNPTLHKIPWQLFINNKDLGFWLFDLGPAPPSKSLAKVPNPVKVVAHPYIFVF